MAKTIIEAIDDTAFKLLQKIGGDSNLTPEQTTVLIEQVKAFDSVIKWAQVRVSLLPKDEARGDKFGGIKSEFHRAGPKTRNRGSDAVKDTPALSLVSSNRDTADDSNGDDSDAG